MNVTLPKPRRWFRFSLRTLFVLVTAFCVWLGWQLHLVRQRNMLVKLVDENYGYAGREIDSEPAGWRTSLLGDSDANVFAISPQTPQQVQDQIASDFPEASIEIIGY